MPTPKKFRRQRGEGTVFYNPVRGVWIGRAPAGVGKSGHTRYREVSDPNQRKLIEKLRAIGKPGPDETVSGWAAKWLASSSARASTVDGYRYTVGKFIGPTLGHFKVSVLTTHHCEKALAQWRQRVGPGTARVYLGQLRNLLNAARRAGLCHVNPARDVRTPRASRRILNPLTPEDLRRIITACQVKPCDWVIALLAATGCRVGEALAMDVTDWNREAGTVTISKTWTRRHGTRGPKSEQGYRTIRVPEPARPALNRAAGKRRSGPLFVVWDGRNRRYHESVRQAFAAVLGRLGLGKRNLHQLRHSAASALVAAGVPIADCAAYLGDRVGTIIETYLHPVASDPSVTMDRLLTSGARVGRLR